MAFVERSRSALVSGLLFGVIGLGFLLDGLDQWRIQVVYIWPLVLMGLGVSVLLGRAQRMEVEEVRATELAVAEERLRIARELHDVVAHGVSLMTVQVGAARKVAESDPMAAKQALTSAEKVGRQSMSELREIVSILRRADASLEAASLRDPADDDDDEQDWAPLPGLDEIDSLIQGTRSAGREVTFRSRGVRRELDPRTELAVYRVVQEALTNSVRHAGDEAKITVRLDDSPEWIEVVVEDDGSARSGQETHKGHGLVGMNERVSSLGGTLEYGPKVGGGWRVKARIPVKEES